jgi:hypothetical protein
VVSRLRLPSMSFEKALSMRENYKRRKYFKIYKIFFRAVLKIILNFFIISKPLQKHLKFTSFKFQRTTHYHLMLSFSGNEKFQQTNSSTILKIPLSTQRLTLSSTSASPSPFNALIISSFGIIIMAIFINSRAYPPSIDRKNDNSSSNSKKTFIKQLSNVPLCYSTSVYSTIIDNDLCRMDFMLFIRHTAIRLLNTQRGSFSAQ